MTDNVVVKKITSADADAQVSSSAFEWLVNNLGPYKYTKTVILSISVADTSTIGKPKHITDFTKTVQVFKKETGLKLGRIYRLAYWRNDNWVYYRATTSVGIYHAIALQDSTIALQFKLAAW
jgi:hypothetical protein